MKTKAARQGSVSPRCSSVLLQTRIFLVSIAGNILGWGPSRMVHNRPVYLNLFKNLIYIGEQFSNYVIFFELMKKSGSSLERVPQLTWHPLRFYQWMPGIRLDIYKARRIQEKNLRKPNLSVIERELYLV